MIKLATKQCMFLCLITIFLSNIVRGELICITEIDPICELEMAKINDKMPDPEAAGTFFTKLVDFVVTPDGSYGRNAMIPHILRGIITQPTVACKSGSILNHVITRDEQPSDNTADKPVNSELFLDKTGLLKWINFADGTVNSPDPSNTRYSDSVIQTLRNIAEQDFRPYFDAAGFDPDLTLAVTFAFTACIEANAIADLEGCVSFGYALAMNGKETKFYTTISAGASVGVGLDLPGSVGFDYSITYDFLGSISSVAGISSSVGLGGSVSGPLTALDDVLFGVNIPTGAGFAITYNGAIPGIDCIAMGLSINAFELGLGFSVSVEASLGSTAEITTDPSITCASDAFNTKFGSVALGDPCTIHEHCANHGLGLTQVACCANKCKHKTNGICPAVSVDEPCCASTDCAGWHPTDATAACCDGKCSDELERSWIGVNECEAQCKAGVGCPVGTCPKESQSAGESCECHEQCQGFGLGLNAMACCNGKCEQKKYGFCEPRPLGADCSLHTDCANWGPETTAVACCQGICTRKIGDWAGLGYCPNECTAGVGCPGGSCGEKNSFGAGQSCSCHEQCQGFGWGLNDMACCNGKCEQKKYGFCGPRPLGADCSLHTDCANWGPGATDVACCQGKCTRKVVDWAGFGYCPHECRNGLTCPLGSCGNSGDGACCGADQNCAGGRTCCWGKCYYKKKDWAGIYYCPQECKGSMWGSAGSC